jgi:hypothetical protein
MRLKNRHDDDVRDTDVRTDDTDRTVRTDRTTDDGTGRRSWFGRDRSTDDGTGRRSWIGRDRSTHSPRRDPATGELQRRESVETKEWRWDFGSVLATAAGVVLVVIGALALVRTGVDSSWYSPVEQVAGIDHTPLLGAIELGVGVLLVLAGLAGARMVAALIAVAGGTLAAVVAFEPDIVDSELALERGWATTLAVAGLALALILVVSRERRHARRVEHHEVRPA